MSERRVRIGCGAGFWGDSEAAAPQLLALGRLNYLVFDYLAEITMSIMAAARLRNEQAGFATDFVTRVMRPCLKTALDQKVRIVTNAGGVNPLACRAALLALAAEQGVTPKIALVLGDDLMSARSQLSAAGVRLDDGAPLPEALLSANAYLGAKPIADALAAGADIVITGRVVDSALVLGPLAHEFGWRWDDFDRLAQGSLAGHIVECGAQATGGLFTDWEEVSGYDDMGYPIVECSEDGNFVLSKPAQTGGLVTPAVVYEQLVYEIGDPRAYVLPDVVCDFSQVHAEPLGPDRVRVSGARGRCPTPHFKVSATYPDGHRVDVAMLLGGEAAAAKARKVAEALFAKVGRLLDKRSLPPFSETRIEVLGAESSYGPHARALDTREVVLRMAARHPDRDALKLLLREIPQAGTSMAPGLASALGGRSEPRTVVRHGSFLIDKAKLQVELDVDGVRQPVAAAEVALESLAAEPDDPALDSWSAAQGTSLAPAHAQRVALIQLARGRSGDKGDISNIGIIAREARFVPILREALSARAVGQHLAHLLDPQHGRVRRYELPACSGWNFVLEHGLGGGGIASLRADPQGKAHAQQLLAFEVPVPEDIYRELSQPPGGSAR